MSEQPQPPNNGIPREIIRWLQTLSLSKPVKHPKRDLCNGYLVAEIAAKNLNKVNDKDKLVIINMNLFDNVLSSQNKLANWKALQKSLAKGGQPQIPEQLVQDVMAAKDGAADQLLMMLYTQFTSRGPPGATAAKANQGAPAEPAPLDRVPQFVKAVNRSGEDGSSAAHHQNEATRQLSAMAAEQLRAAELELMKQRDEHDLRKEVLGLGGEKGGAGGEPGAGGVGLDADAAALAQQQEEARARKARLLRGPAVPQTLAQAQQIKGIDLEAEKQETKAILFNQVSVRQLSGAALQRFGFRDRSQSPSARGNQQQNASPKSFGGANKGRGGGVGAAIHHHLSSLLDRFVADYFAASTTWNPPADASPLSYFIENCSNAQVITPSFKLNLWAYLHHHARSTAAVLATAPIDTLYFVAHFANVCSEGNAPRPGDPSFSDFSKPKFFGADVFDATYYCHVVLGALREAKKGSADAILRRYAFPAILPVIFRKKDASFASTVSTAAAQVRSASLSIRRALFAISGLAVGNQQPRGTKSLGSCLRFLFTEVEQNLHSNNEHQQQIITEEDTQNKIINNGYLLHQFIEMIFDSILINYESTVAFSGKLFSLETLSFLTPGNTNCSISTVDRAVEFYNCLEVICASIRSDILLFPNAQQQQQKDIFFPSGITSFMIYNIERGLAHESSSVQEASLRTLTALAQVDTESEEVFQLVLSQLQNNLLPALQKPRGIHNMSASSGTFLLELIRLLSVTMSRSSKTEDQMLALAADAVSSLHALALRDAERLVLVAALCSGIFGMEVPSTSSSSPSSVSARAPNPKITIDDKTATFTDDQMSSAQQQQQVDSNNATSNNTEHQKRTQNWNVVTSFCVDSLLALPPSALEVFASTGGSLPRALPSIMASVQDRLAFAAPLDFSRWNLTALGLNIANRFATGGLKIVGASKTGAAGVLKLPTPPSPQAKPQDFAKYILPYRHLILLFTLMLARLNAAMKSSTESGNFNSVGSEVGQCSTCSILRNSDDNANWWNALYGGFATDLKRLLLYYDASRKGASAIAPRTTPEAESFHEIYIQAGRAALFITTKLYRDISNSVSSSVQPNISSMLLALASRVSVPASKIADDDRVLGQTGLEVAGKAIEWLMTSVIASNNNNLTSSMSMNANTETGMMGVSGRGGTQSGRDSVQSNAR